MRFLDKYILRDIVSDDAKDCELIRTKLNPFYNFGYGFRDCFCFYKIF
jgi:hypothetical protein